MEVTVSLEGGCNPCQIVYPNPSSEELNVVFVEKDSSDKENTSRLNEVLLIGKNQSLFFQLSTRESHIKIPTSELPDGLYFLKVKNNQGSSTTQVSIKH
jgi:hypothetical protein